MAYDRYDARDRNYGRSRNRDDDRGFFERAGDEVASWFGDEDAERRRREDERRERSSGQGRDYDRGYGRNYDRDRSQFRSSGRDFDPNRSRDDDRGFLPEHGYLRSEYEPGYQETSERDRRGERSSWNPMNWTSSDRDYRQGRSSSDRDDERPRFSTGEARSRSAYGASRSGADREDEYRDTSWAGSDRGHDRHYHAWRQRQMDELDRDYDHYRRENQERFESDFGSWRNDRMGKRQRLSSIREHMDVVGSDGEPVGKVDKVRGDRVILTKSDSDDNRHHSFDCSMIENIEGDEVRLNAPAEEAKSRLHDEQDRGALFGSGRKDGPHNLERSFSGTYR